MKYFRFIFVLAILPLVLSSSIVSAQAPEDAAGAKEVFLARYDAIMAGDVETSLSYLPEDHIAVVLPPPPGTDPVSVGIDANRQTLEYLVSDNISYDFTNIEVQGNTLTFRALVHTDLFRFAEVNPIAFSGTAVVQDGKLLSTTWLMNQYDDARLGAALAEKGNKAILTRAYTEVFNQGNFDVLDEDISPDAIDHSSPDLKGVDAFKLPMQGIRAALPDLQATPNMIISEGDLVIAHTTFTGTHEGEFAGIPPSGEEISWSHVDINRIENGQVVEAWHIGTEAMLEAFGFKLIPPSE